MVDHFLPGTSQRIKRMPFCVNPGSIEKMLIAALFCMNIYVNSVAMVANYSSLCCRTSCVGELRGWIDCIVVSC